jgi:hypothetical protein
MSRTEGGSEHEHQSALFQWIRLRAQSDERFAVIFAVPNGFKGDKDARKAAEAARWLKDEGMEPGVPDVCVPVPTVVRRTNAESYEEGACEVKPLHFAWWDGSGYEQCYPGLFIEMKAPYRRSKTGRGKGGVEPEQEVWIDRLRRLGWRVEVCYSCDEARALICEYLELPLD